MKYLIISIFAALFMVSCNSIQDKQAENSQSTLEETDLSNSKKPKFICTDEYMEVTKDTYNYYLKKLKHSGLLENLNGDVDETIQKKINSDEIICFLSLTEYGEEENILIEPFQAEIDENIFNGLKSAIESQQVTKNEENIMFRLLDSGKGIYGKNSPFYYFKTVTLIKDIFFIRYSLTYLINIDGKPYSIVINTHDIEKEINNTILSINDISSNEESSSLTQDENINSNESIIWENKLNGLYIDSRDGKTYKVIKIGNQIWFAENLAHIPSNYNYSDKGIWIYDVKNEKIQDAVYSDNYKTYGCLYNWTTAKKICPDGWYLPSDSDWNKLEIYTREQDEKNPGGILKSIPEWDSPNVGANNSIGFAAKPGGDYRIHYRQFYDIGKLANFWSSTPIDAEYAWARTLSYKNGDINRESWLKGHGFSVRCIKNSVTNSSYKQQDSKISNNNYQLTSVQSEDKIIFLDGVKVSKSLIVNSCLEYTKKEGLDELIIADNYCNCFAERLGENFKSTDVSFLFENIESEKELYSAAIRFYNLPVVKEIAEDCIKDNLTDSNENFSISSEEEKEALITVFKNALKTQEGYEELKQLINIDDFCECVVVKILDNFSYKEIMTDPNLGENPKYIQIQEDCMFKHKKESIY